MELVFERRLSASPAAVWPFVVEPSRMNCWSRARIVGVASGDGDSFSGVGALRRVELPGGRSLGRLLEVVVASEPPVRFEYRVIGNPLIREHQGVIRLAPGPGGTALTWRVRAQMRGGAGWLVRPLLRSQLEASLAELARVVCDAPAPQSAGEGRFSDAGTSELWRRAEEIAVAQRAAADEMRRQGDPKQWFARVYAAVSAAQLDHARSGAVEHVGWVLRLIPAFHHHYQVNLDAWNEDRRGEVEAHWQRAFERMERGPGGARDQIFGGLHRGVRAHIEGDLPRALASVYQEHYAGCCSYARFRADYLGMAGLFERATLAVMPEFPPGLVPLWARVSQALSPALASALRARRFYDIGRARRRAFDDGAELARAGSAAWPPGSGPGPGSTA